MSDCEYSGGSASEFSEPEDSASLWDSFRESNELVSEGYSEWESTKPPVGQPPAQWLREEREILFGDEPPSEPSQWEQSLQQMVERAHQGQEVCIRVTNGSKASVRRLCKLMFHFVDLHRLHISTYLDNGPEGRVCSSLSECVANIPNALLENDFDVEGEEHPIPWLMVAQVAARGYIEEEEMVNVLPPVIVQAKQAADKKLLEALPFEAAQLSQCLHALPNLRRLRVYIPYELGAVARASLGNALLKTRARSVTLETVEIGYGGCKLLADVVASNSNPHVRHLSLICCEPGSLKDFMQAFKTNSTLLSLCFLERCDYNSFKLLCRALASNFTLTTLSFRMAGFRQPISLERRQKLVSILSANRWLVHIDMYGCNGLKPEDVEPIVTRNVAQRKELFEDTSNVLGLDLAEVVFSYAFGDVNDQFWPVDRHGFVPLRPAH